MTAHEILTQVLSDADGCKDSALLALEDGQYLASIGVKDEDQEAVEIAYAELKN